VANKKATSKSNNIGSKQDQEKRSNDRFMSKRCELQGINYNYWPVPVEGDGQTSANFEAFLKTISDAASELRNPGHDSSSFKRKWKILLACKLAKNKRPNCNISCNVQSMNAVTVELQKCLHLCTG
jgi:hypothetical protein